MKKIIMLGFFIFSILGMAAPYRDNRGVLFMETEEWIKFYNKEGQEVAACPVKVI